MVQPSANFRGFHTFRSQPNNPNMSRNSGSVVSIENIPTLSESYAKLPKPTKELANAPDRVLSDRISLWRGDMTKLKIDAIVNAANESLLGGGGIDGAIHNAAGRDLLAECRKLNGCKTGSAKITKGYKLPAQHVIHTVGPQGEYKDTLEKCYRSVLDIVKEKELTTVAFCCVSTGIYGYDNLKAAHVALDTVGNWLRENYDYAMRMERVIFCTFLEIDQNIYEKLLPEYFPQPITDDTSKGTKS
ncbi:O-acetyl-ADP-ribose deacetylase macrod1 [Haplosporangium sp. Z 27]|nr:O-acetyl-ADP-ribose deacetylase macrod1 [Haplosporangium sp. Z 27]